MQKEDLVIELQLQQGQPWCLVRFYRKKLIIIIVNSSHKYLYNYEFPCSWMVVHVWESNTYIEELDHYSFTNCIIFYLWEKLKYIFSHPHKATKLFGLPSIGAISFLLLQYEAKDTQYGGKKWLSCWERLPWSSWHFSRGGWRRRQSVILMGQAYSLGWWSW